MYRWGIYLYIDTHFTLSIVYAHNTLFIHVYNHRPQRYSAVDLQRRDCRDGQCGHQVHSRRLGTQRGKLTSLITYHNLCLYTRM